ncbi:TAP-like protein-domain-containing protein [Xylariaceae sp. FL0255]|nr:TAP-like protein-domain-containing protein [Xylariaceae sp. FL0255]
MLFYDVYPQGEFDADKWQVRGWRYKRCCHRRLLDAVQYLRPHPLLLLPVFYLLFYSLRCAWRQFPSSIMFSSIQLTVAAILGASQLSAAAPFTQDSTSYQTISWGSCDTKFPSNHFPSNLTCGTIRVPLDWNHPEKSEQISLGLVRLAASDKANRIGPLFINPGGPGGSATSIVTDIVELPNIVDPEILERFDLIGLDPRGVGVSTPLQCDPATYNKRVKFFPKTQDEFDELVQYNKDFAASCIAKSGSLIHYLDTISAAKDHEAVRLALGGEKASFLGLSYGTQLFSQYAALYPHSFRAIVLDGNVQHSQAEVSNLLAESMTFEATLKQFFAWCDGSDECALRGKDVEAVFTALVDQAAATPIPAPGCDGSSCRTDVTDEDILLVTQESLSLESAWPGLAEGLLEASTGNATILSQSNQIAVGDAYADSGLYAGTGIACQDWTHASTSLYDVVQKQIIGAAFAPFTRGFTQTYRIQTGCIGWPAAVTNPPAPIKYTGNVPLLLVNSNYDPETSYVWAVGLEAEIGAESVLLTRNGSGHTSYELLGEAAAIENKYLLDLELPAKGTVVST